MVVDKSLKVWYQAGNVAIPHVYKHAQMLVKLLKYKHICLLSSGCTCHRGGRLLPRRASVHTSGWDKTLRVRVWMWRRVSDGYSLSWMTWLEEVRPTLCRLVSCTCWSTEATKYLVCLTVICCSLFARAVYRVSLILMLVVDLWFLYFPLIFVALLSPSNISKYLLYDLIYFGA